MAKEAFRIEIDVGVKDSTDPGISSASKKLTAFDKSAEKTQKRLDQMSRSRWKVTIEAIDKVTSVIAHIGSTVRGVAGRAWSFAVSVVDKVSAPVKSMISKLGELLSIGTAVSAVLGGISVADMLSASRAQNTVETQLKTVLANVTDVENTYDRILQKASSLQQTTMYGDESYIAGAAELATYISDADALESMMEVLSDYAAGMSGGAELSVDEMVNYATQLGKALNGADASFDGLTKKGFTFTEAQKKILQSDLTSDMEKVAVLAEVIGDSWGGLAQAFANTPAAKVTQFKNAWGDMKEVIGDRLYPAVGDLFDMLGDKIPGIQDLLEGGADGLSDLIESLIPSFGEGIDLAIQKVNDLKDKISGIVDSDEFQNADLFGKIGILWDELIAQPFSDWWESTGRQYFVDKAGELGETIGTGLSNGLLALLGFDGTDAVEDGKSIGSSFIEGFKQGFDTEQITQALRDWAEQHKEIVIGIGAVVGFNLITGLAQKLNGLTGLFKGGGSGGSGGSGDLGLGNAATASMSVQANLVNLTGDHVNDLRGGMETATTSTMTVTASVVYVNGPNVSTAANAAQSFAKLLGKGTGTGLLGSGGASAPAALPGGSQLLLPAGGGAAAAGGGAAEAAAGSSAVGGIATAASVAGIVTMALAYLGLEAKGVVDTVNAVKESNAGNDKAAKTSAFDAGIDWTVFASIAALLAGGPLGQVLGAAGLGASTAAAGGSVSDGYGLNVGDWLSDATDEGGWLDTAYKDVTGFFESTFASIGETIEPLIPDWAKDVTSNHIEPFFSTTLPGWVSTLKDTTSGLVEPLIPTWASEIGTTVTTWFSQIKSWVSSTLSSAWDSVSGWFSGTFGGNKGRSGGGGKFASGGFVSGPQTALVGEEGLEAIIPLTPSKRDRGLDLWMAAGRMLGVEGYADGGIVGDETAPVTAGNSGNRFAISVNLSPSFTVQGGGDDEHTVNVIRSHIREMADDIADELADRLDRAFSNIPLKGEV